MNRNWIKSGAFCAVSVMVLMVFIPAESPGLKVIANLGWFVYFCACMDRLSKP